MCLKTGGTYYVGCQTHNPNVGAYSDATAKYVSGDYFPLEVNTGDVYVYGDYEYRYKMDYNGGVWGTDVEMGDGWGVRVLSTTKTQYSDILSSINGMPVVSLEATFYECVNMVTAPKLPDSIIIMECTFIECDKLLNVVIPKNVIDLDGAFMECDALVSAPSIPSTVNSMEGTFEYCKNLKNGTTIPSGVENIYGVYGCCPKLTGTITINASNLTNYGYAFWNTELSIVLTGSSSLLTQIAATATNGNVTVAN